MFWRNVLVSCIAFFPISAFGATFSVDTIALSGEKAFDTQDGETFESFGLPNLNAVGTAVFRANLQGDSVNTTNNAGIFTSTGLVARKGDTVPGEVDKIDELLGLPHIGGDGNVAYLTRVRPFGTGNISEALLVDDKIRVRRGDEVPGTEGDDRANATFLDISVPRINKFGTIAYRGILTGGDVNTTGDNVTGIFTTTADGTTAISLRAGDAVGDIAGATFTNLVSGANPRINNQGQVAVRAGFEGDDVTTGVDNIGYFVDGSLVVRRGDAAPGTDGARFAVLDLSFDFNDGGMLAFRASLTAEGATPDADSGIFTSGGLVARKGDVAPGAGGATYTGFNAGPSLNNLGEVAFAASLSDGTIGLFLHDALGIAHLILQTGQDFTIGAGDDRTISSLNVFSGALNDSMLAFILSFEDGSSGVFTATIDRSSIAPIPLPASVLLLLSALAGIGLAARWRRAAA